MLKILLSGIVSGLLLLGPAAQLTVAKQKRDKEAITVESVKAQVAKLGLGEKAKTIITLKNGTRTKGYIARTGEEDFVIRDRQTDSPTTIRYADVANVDETNGHSNAKAAGISAAVGVGVFAGLILILLNSRGHQ